MSISKTVLISAMFAAAIAAPAFANDAPASPTSVMRCQDEMEDATAGNSKAAAIGFATGQKGVQVPRGPHCRIPVDVQRLAIQFATGARGASMKNLHRCASMDGDGIVSSISGGEVTLQHDVVAGMPAMTMTFGVADQALLRDLAAGDRVHFRLKPSGDHYLVDQISKQ